jgi:hypothetical protein
VNLTGGYALHPGSSQFDYHWCSFFNGICHDNKYAL